MSAMNLVWDIEILVEGEGVMGRPLVLDAPLSLWGGLDPHTGVVIDQRHPQVGACVTGRVMVLPSGRGSSSASSILLEAVREGTAPVAIVTAVKDDGILALGAVVAREIYGKGPVVGFVKRRYEGLVEKVRERENCQLSIVDGQLSMIGTE